MAEPTLFIDEYQLGDSYLTRVLKWRDQAGKIQTLGVFSIEEEMDGGKASGKDSIRKQDPS